ncbi:DUF4118 domain-containing protein [Lysobacter sp. KIS68-7]|uniref:sensor histidine kinase n=1 Tax=Lysobacter sp. KIS68-7 TaxID=2904252 RepID=UPI001E3561F5|nr:DUF4118 domain-containing protein [Lysobacter sp. KIS68-7]UHQ20501.1 DUF4118 domain-containing protein [Lysobacter sp. KIS68-7]
MDAPAPKRKKRTQPATDFATGLVLAIVGAALATGVAALAERWLGLADVSLVFMLAVLIVATRTRTGPAMVCAVLCFLAYNYFFISPRYTFYVDAPHGVATVVLFLCAAVIAGRLASRLVMQLEALRETNRHTETLERLARALGSATDEANVVAIARAAFAEGLDAEAWLRSDVDQVASTGQHGWWFLPLRAGDQPLGALALKRAPGREAFDIAERRMALAMADDIAQALLRTRLSLALNDARIANETERLRSALLASVSHDLRTPLAAILGAAGSLQASGVAALTDADRDALLDIVRSEGERLDGYIRNLLDMTRIAHGQLVPERDWIGTDELIGAALARLRRAHPEAQVATLIAPDLAPLHVQPALIEQALYNLLDNAVKFAGHAPIAIDAQRTEAGGTRIDVRDRGPGITETERERVFDMFRSMAQGDRGRRGSGLGLAIARGMLRAHGGDVTAGANPDGGGACLRITLPRAPSQPVAPDEDAA